MLSYGNHCKKWTMFLRTLIQVSYPNSWIASVLLWFPWHSYEQHCSCSCLCCSYHYIINGIINIRIPLPPSHFRTIWDYKNADTSSIQRAVENFNWQYAFESKTILEKVQVLNEVSMNILSNFVPHKLLKF